MGTGGKHVTTSPVADGARAPGASEAPRRRFAPVRRAEERLRDIAGGEDPTPLVVLFLLFFFDEFDTGAFNTLAPNIKASFDLTDQEFGAIVVLNLGIVLLFAIPVGHLGDRLKRVALVAVGAFVAATFSFLTGVVTSAALLLVVRIGNGMGRLVNDPIHTSLLTDWYQPFHRPRVFAAHRNAQQLGAIGGALVAGSIGALFGWRWAFLVLVVPIATVAVWATRLVEPARGATDGGVVEAPLPFREAARTTLHIRTLRRAYLAATIIGGGLVPLAVLGPLFLDEVFGLDDFARGVVTALGSAATFAGIQLSGRLTQQWMVKGMGEPMRRAGLLVVLVGVQIGLLAAAPNVWLYVLISSAASFTAGVFLPPLLTTQAFVAPARVRSLVFSFSSIFFVIGAAAFFASPLGRLSDTVGIRWGMFASAPCWVLGGIVAITAARFVTDDASAAFAP
jgi:MFS family permease